MSENTQEKSSLNYEFNSFTSSDQLFNSIFGCGIDRYFSKEDIDAVLQDPILNHSLATKLARMIYTKSGVVSSTIDSLIALPCLDYIVTTERSKFDIGGKKAKANKELFKKALKMINHKSFIRDALFTEANDGICFYYFDTKAKKMSNQKYFTDMELDAISEINEEDINIAITTLPYDYTQIIGKKNGRYVLAFDLDFFREYSGEKLENKLRKYPSEITTAWEKYNKNGMSGAHWVRLDSDKTICKKIKCKDSEPWGRPLAISALDDILYRDQFIDTKRTVMDEQQNRIFYQEFPEGSTKGLCSLTSNQQTDQHNAVKTAVMQKNNRGGTSFFSVAAGTKICSLDVKNDIFSDDYESNLDDQIAVDMGICGALLGSSTATSNFATATLNLEIVTAQMYKWIDELTDELNYVINANVIKDKKHKTSVYYFPTSFVNREKEFSRFKDLYTLCGGSLSVLVATSGIDVDTYFAILDEEIEDGIFDRYKVHPTSFTTPGDNPDNKGGRPPIDAVDSTNENTITSKSNNGNKRAKPTRN